MASQDQSPNQGKNQGENQRRRVSTLVLWPLLAGVALFAGAVTLSRCFSPTLPACSFICNTTDPKCPDDYECRSDNYCHLTSSSETCPYSMDLTPAPVVDMLDAGDMATAADLTVAPDMTTPADMTAADM
jgi:hypothetical protein